MTNKNKAVPLVPGGNVSVSEIIERGMTTLQVEQFHEIFKHPINDTPEFSVRDQDKRVLNRAINDMERALETLKLPHKSNPILRFALILEELLELAEATASGNALGVLDALTDIDYVLAGTWISLGFAGVRGAAVEEVHRANMSKLGSDGEPIYRKDGKVMKGPDYTPPNLIPILKMLE